MALRQRKTEGLSLVLKPKLMKKLRDEARKHKRSVNDFVNLMLEERYFGSERRENRKE